MTQEQIVESFLSLMKRILSLQSSVALLVWDLHTIAPPKGKEARAQVIGSVSTEVFRLSTSKEFVELLEGLEQHEDTLSVELQRMAYLARKGYDRNHKIPSELYEAYCTAQQLSQTAWAEAKHNNDFAAFAPHLQKMIDYNRQFAEIWGYEDNPYDALLDGYEPELTVTAIDGIFATLQRGTRTILQTISEVPCLPSTQVMPEQQKQIGEYLLNVIGYDLEAGNLYTTEHPFSATIHQGDSRVTTKYHIDQPVSSIFSVLHEGGHGMYEQNFDPSYNATELSNGCSMGIHESQSRLWENIIGRSLAFWEANFATVNQMAGGHLAKDAQTFYQEINRVEPSLIRIEADELTYNLHIIIRYEIEKMIFTKGLNAQDLPAVWNDKYEEYLGVRPNDDTQGILQDMHWSDGSFGYFPSYSMGNLYGAQIAHTIEQQLGSLEELIAKEDGLRQIKAWLVDKIYRYGAMEQPADLLRRVTGEDLNPDYLLTYYQKKYTKDAK